MCDPMTAIGVGLSAMGQMAGFQAEQQAVKAHNAAAKQNAINAGLAATRKYTDEGRVLAHEAKETNQEGFDAIMKARQAQGTGVASAGTAGMDLASGTVQAVLSDINRQEADTQYRVQDRHDRGKENYLSKVEQHKAEAQNRINSMPLKPKPSPIGMILGIATEAFGAIPKGR